MFDKKELCQFLVKAKTVTYAAGDFASKVVNDDKSTTMIFEDGDWKYHDNYFGGEPYGGREVAFYKGQPIYMMVYYGLVHESVVDIKQIYKILMNALKLIPENRPYRGPEKYQEGGFEYLNNISGEIEDFSGEEVINKNGQEIYRAKYIGGFVDLRK